ncbi:Kinesin-like protein KIF22 [Aphelenchoides avenae]|nr:Kinesin-like protein KIF22 [Aphelenchus avenae]
MDTDWQAVSYRDLQKKAKELGIRANQKKETLVAAITAHYADAAAVPPPDNTAEEVAVEESQHTEQTQEIATEETMEEALDKDDNTAVVQAEESGSEETMEQALDNDDNTAQQVAVQKTEENTSEETMEQALDNDDNTAVEQTQETAAEETTKEALDNDDNTAVEQAQESGSEETVQQALDNDDSTAQDVAVQKTQENTCEETVETALHEDDNTAEEAASDATYVVESDGEGPDQSIKTTEAFPTRNSFFSDDDSPTSSRPRRSSASRRSIIVPHITSTPTKSSTDAKYRLAWLSDESVGEEDQESAGPSGSLKRFAAVQNLNDSTEDLKTAQSPSDANLSLLSEDNDEELPSRRSSAALLPSPQSSTGQVCPALRSSRKSSVVAQGSSTSTPVRKSARFSQAPAESRNISVLSEDNHEEHPSRHSSAALQPLLHTSINQGSRKSYVVTQENTASTSVRKSARFGQAPARSPNTSLLSDDNDGEQLSCRSSAAVLPSLQTSTNQGSPVRSGSRKSYIVAQESIASTPVRKSARFNQTPSESLNTFLDDNDEEEQPSRRSNAAPLPLLQTSIDQGSPAPSGSRKSYVVTQENIAGTPVRKSARFRQAPAESHNTSLLSDDNDQEQPSRTSSAALLPSLQTSDQGSPVPSGSRKSFVVAPESIANTPVRKSARFSQAAAESRNYPLLLDENDEEEQPSRHSSVPMAMRSRSIVAFEEIEHEVLKTPGGTVQGTPASSSRKRKISTTTDDTPPPRKSSLLAGGALGIKINQPGGRSGKENSPSTSSCVSKKSTPGSAGRRFDAVHQKMFDAMDSIDVAEEKKQQRLTRLAQTTPDRINRLATPKNCSRSHDRATPTTTNVPAFDKPKHPSTVDFRFGDVDVTNIAKVQKPPGTFSSSVPPKPSALPRFVGAAKVRLHLSPNSNFLRAQMDVKQRTMTASRAARKSTTTPAVSERLERLSTPKTLPVAGPSSRRAASISTSYTPKKGRFQFVDTTKMSDAELARFQQQQQAAAGSRIPLDVIRRKVAFSDISSDIEGTFRGRSRPFPSAQRPISEKVTYDACVAPPISDACSPHLTTISEVTFSESETVCPITKVAIFGIMSEIAVFDIEGDKVTASPKEPRTSTPLPLQLDSPTLTSSFIHHVSVVTDD